VRLTLSPNFLLSRCLHLDLHSAANSQPPPSTQPRSKASLRSAANLQKSPSARPRFSVRRRPSQTRSVPCFTSHGTLELRQLPQRRAYGQAKSASSNSRQILSRLLPRHRQLRQQRKKTQSQQPRPKFRNPQQVRRHQAAAKRKARSPRRLVRSSQKGRRW
jgi:hypothetical protein